MVKVVKMVWGCRSLLAPLILVEFINGILFTYVYYKGNFKLLISDFRTTESLCGLT